VTPKTRLRTYSACILQNTSSKDLFPLVGKVFSFLDMTSVADDILMTILLLRFYRSFYISSVEAKGVAVKDQRIDLPQGTLDLLILRTLALGPQHGWAISERVQQVSSDVLQIQQGSLYPALHRLERRGWIIAEWGASDKHRRAKYYELTRSGTKQLEVETDAWLKLTTAVTQVLEGA
jgi:PadR family transcriptional regulator, regulatory protein PadR